MEEELEEVLRKIGVDENVKIKEGKREEERDFEEILSEREQKYMKNRGMEEEGLGDEEEEDDD